MMQAQPGQLVSFSSPMIYHFHESVPWISAKPFIPSIWIEIKSFTKRNKPQKLSFTTDARNQTGHHFF